MVPSSSGLGRGPLKAKTRVQISLGPPIIMTTNNEKSALQAFFIISDVPERETRRVQAISRQKRA